ncbi:MAG: phosphoribosyl-AMP cyclohydrolase [Porticoccaceae bacterium]
MTAFLDKIAWNSDGLVPAIAQDYQSGKILMMAWMNAESLALTVEENRAIYWSRSRQKLWRKGEESGHVQHIKEIRLDCDSDVIILKVDQVGGIACHTGRESCFYYVLEEGEWKAVDPVLKNQEDIYS